MFLDQLETKSAQSLFLELACLVAMIEGDSIYLGPLEEQLLQDNSQEQEPKVATGIGFGLAASSLAMGGITGRMAATAAKLASLGEKQANYSESFNSLIPKERKDYIAPYASFIDQAELEKLNAYIKEFGQDESYFKNLLEHSLTKTSKRGKFNSLKFIFDEVKKEILLQYESNDLVKKAIFEKLIQQNYDLLSLDKELIQTMILELPEIKLQVFQNVLNKLIEERNAQELSERDKKIIIFELIGLGISNNYFAENELKIIREISNKIGSDSEYIDEFIPVINNLYQNQKQAIELINE